MSESDLHRESLFYCYAVLFHLPEKVNQCEGKTDWKQSHKSTLSNSICIHDDKNDHIVYLFLFQFFQCNMCVCVCVCV